MHDCKIQMMCLTSMDTLLTVDSDCNVGVSILSGSGWEAQGLSCAPCGGSGAWLGASGAGG
jgi:hypothetical protein